MFGSGKNFLIVLNNFYDLLSEALRHVVDGFQNKFVAFFLENIFLSDQVLNQFNDKLFLGDSVRGDDGGVIEIDTGTDCHENFHVFQIGLNCCLCIQRMLFACFEKFYDIFLKNSV